MALDNTTNAPRLRHWRSFVVLALVLCGVAGIVWAATNSDGRTGTQTTTNDGGAWLLKRDAGAIGHLNREVLEVTAGVRVADAGADFDVDQAGDLILVHDRSTTQLSLIDGRTHLSRGNLLVPVGVSAMPTEMGVVVHSNEPLIIWSLTEGRLLEIGDIENEQPSLQADASGSLAITTSGDVAAFVPSDNELTWIEGSVVTMTSITDVEMPSDIRLTTAVGNRAVFVGDQSLAVVTNDGSVTTHGLRASPVSLQQAASAGDSVVGVTEAGDMIRIRLDDGDVEVLHTLESADVLPLIDHGGCQFVVMRSTSAEATPVFEKVCAGNVVERSELTGTGAELRLRLVNGWVWINDLETGGAWITSPDSDLARIDDWGAALADENLDESDATTEDGGGIEEVQINPDAEDAELIEADELDEDAENEPPVVRPDEASTRIDRPVIVPVLANDEDADGDVLLVSEVFIDGPPGVLAGITPTRDGVQLSPPAGFVGTIRFEYSVTDGRGGSGSAEVVVEVSANSAESNRPPEPVTDVAAARAGSPVSLDLLANDSDPDGDALVLLDVSSDTGSVVFDPGGELTFTPDTTGTDAQIELAYTVADDFGATAEGRVLVNVRLEDANNPPDARNDSVVTSVGSPARLNVLENDNDPDDDPLLVARQPILVSDPNGPVAVGAVPSNGDGTVATGGTAQVTTDGEFFFVPDQPGTYLFEYLISDGQNNDKAQIRVDVTEATTNEPPVAVRDDVTIPIGGTRIVYALDNDGDPNGDVVGIVEWSGTDGLLVEEIPGIGFKVTVEPTAPPRAVFRYAISDGVNEPVGTAVVVAVVDVEPVNQPPIVRPDAVEVRAGRSTTIKALANDYDPEGGSLEILRAAEILGVDAQMSVGPQGQSISLTVGPEVRSGFTFGYDVRDEDGASSASVIEVRVIAPGEPNRAPIARPDVGRTIADVAVAVEVLANDSDPDGDAIQVESIATQPANGEATVLEDGSIRYEPISGFTGTDRFSYVLIDTEGERSVGVVQVGVTPESRENRPPSANPDTFNVVAGAGPVVLDVLANDFDPDNDPLSVLSATTTSAGTITVGSDGSVVYTPPAEIAEGLETLETSFTYGIADDAGNEAEAIVTVVIEVAPDPIPPVAVDDQAGPVRARSEVTVNVVANDTDPDGELADLVVTSDDPDVVVSGQQISITAGTESSQHSYTITDADELTSTATITLFVVENEAPVVSPLTVETANETPVSLTLAAQASDIDEDPLFFVCCDNTRGGIATIDASGEGVLNVTFEPSPGFSGVGGFSYSVDDQQGHLVSASVTVNVLPPDNRPPTAVDGNVSVEAASAEKGLGVPFDLAGLVTDPDIDDTLTFDVTPNPGSLDINVTGSTVVISAPATAAGETATVSFTATDSFGESTAGTLNISVTPVSDPPPQAVADTGTTNQGQAIEINVVGNDVDPLGQGLTISQVGASPDGVTAQGPTPDSVVFTPNNEFFGTTTFTYTVRDGADADDRTSLGQVTVDVIGRPDAPAPPAATADNAVATITWITPASNGSLVDAYILEYEDITGGGTQSIELGAINSHTWNGLTNGNEYRFRVQARNVAGWGDFSGWSAPVRPDTIPEAPASPLVQFGDGQLQVTWTPPPNDGSAITGYKLEIGAGDSQIVTLGAGTSYDWTNLTNGVEYQFRVAAVNAAGDSDWSGWSASEHPLGPPLAAAAPIVNRGDQFLDVTWGAPNNNGDPIQQYEVEMRSSGQVVTIADGGTTSYRWANLANGVEQEYRVRAINRDPQAGAWSGWSNPVKPCAAPDQPGAPSVVRGDTEVNVSWSPPNDQGCAISGYTITANGTTVQTAGAGATSHTFTGLTNGTPYTFRIIATNEEGDSTESAASASVTPAGPPLPGPTIANATPTAVGQISISYSGALPNGSPITGHEVRINNGAPIPGGASGYVATGLAPSANYDFEVRACNIVGCSGWSNVVSATTWGPPTVPTGVSASAGNATITLFWNAPNNDGGAPGLAYSVVMNPNNFANSSQSGNSFTWNGVTNGVTHTLSVTACNDVGCSAPVATTATPQAPPPVASISRGSPYSSPECTDPSCARVFVSVSNLAPNEAITISCYSNNQGAPYATYNRTADGSGSHAGEQCFFGIPGRTVWVTVFGNTSGSFTSNSFVW